MYIEPDSVIKILKSVPLDTTYENTIWWNTKVAQTTYFTTGNNVLITLQRQSYQRHNRGVLRIDAPLSVVYCANYMAFKNTSYENKWFYAFILKVDYINNNVCEITYTLDVLQTWYFDYNLEACLVEREHTSTDVAGDNIVREDLDTGEYVVQDYGARPLHPYQNHNNDCIVVACTYYRDGLGISHDSYGGVYNNEYSGLNYEWFELPDDTDTEADKNLKYLSIINFLNSSKAESVVSIYYAPRIFVTWPHTDTAYETGGIIYDYTHSTNEFSLPNLQEIMACGYTPRNKKLLTYPFNFLYVTNYRGDSAVYPYEYFEQVGQRLVQFTLYGDALGNPECMIVPKYYKGNPENFDEKFTLSGFPMMGFATDTFKAWLAQTAATILPTAGASGLRAYEGVQKSRLIAETFQSKMSAAVANAAPYVAVTGLAARAADLLGQGIRESIQPRHAKSTNNGGLLLKANLLDFGFYEKGITEQYAHIIDDYFDMYGYACHSVKVPNRDVRDSWCYTKTTGCQISGDIPTEDRQAIESIYDEGVRFWQDPSYVLDYSRSNRPKSEQVVTTNE